MSELTVGSRYAKSLIDLAIEQNALEATQQDMAFFVRTLKANPELNAVLRNPIISHDKKLKVLEGVFTDRVSANTLAFFKIMINKGRGEVLFSAAKEFINQYNIKQKIVNAKVVSAAPLSEANKQQIVADVQSIAGAQVNLHAVVDPSLIGGFVLTVGDRQIDTSVATSLKRLQKDFAQKVV
ncbi:ATP synthase F1 subunit delta [Mucilaginibacter sp. Bleaf8]|uniref:ATP synthase F1 subunit delta n=1 Tax=Mucilaginibacter sp. Bleaf8 TaxID=2834430 RepID=UPI001BCAB52A|nr:ATP synthase F1 subunit delta [Mucilaginibacter sp. Bleaf8]MBS7564314.1 ATP synthase F1 subunit delta [Mucilaginibacter sp. Bleaf8]